MKWIIFSCSIILIIATIGMLKANKQSPNRMIFSAVFVTSLCAMLFLIIKSFVQPEYFNASLIIMLFWLLRSVYFSKIKPHRAKAIHARVATAIGVVIYCITVFFKQFSKTALPWLGSAALFWLFLNVFLAFRKHKKSS